MGVRGLPGHHREMKMRLSGRVDPGCLSPFPCHRKAVQPVSAVLRPIAWPQVMYSTGGEYCQQPEVARQPNGTSASNGQRTGGTWRSVLAHSSRVTLRSDNDRYQDIVHPTADVRMQGKVKAVVYRALGTEA